jgi:hypothetical protein
LTPSPIAAIEEKAYRGEPGKKAYEPPLRAAVILLTELEASTEDELQQALAGLLAHALADLPLPSASLLSRNVERLGDRCLVREIATWIRAERFPSLELLPVV